MDAKNVIKTQTNARRLVTLVRESELTPIVDQRGPPIHD
jgi:hypothetical protein